MNLNNICEECFQSFSVKETEVKRGGGRFCNRKCAAIFRVKNTPPPAPNVTCKYCNTKFYKSTSQMRSKSGFYFCSRSCKDNAQCIDGPLAINVFVTYRFHQ